MKETSIRAEICIFPYPIEKVRDSQYPYSYHSMRRFLVKMETCSDNMQRASLSKFKYLSNRVCLNILNKMSII